LLIADDGRQLLKEAAMGELGIIYVIVGALFVALAGWGMWRIRGRREVRHDSHSGLTEVEEARRNIPR
jgi:hypothetical protein